jgi:tRNA modification GTPase
MDTIVALATPFGRSGIGVIRLSGGTVLSILRELTGGGMSDPDPRLATLAKLAEPATGEIIDEALITYFKAPHSFTGEDVIEISCHGSPVLLRRIIDICLHLNARMAEPGEFTLRALSNGRIDLAQAEAIRDLIDSNSIAMTRQAMRQLGGEFSHRLQPIKDRLLDAIVILESALEFVEDDLPATQTERLAGDLRGISEELAGLAATFKAGKLLREGLKVALVGRPNVGKSSLFNALLGQDRAIVTEIPGTTRDQILESFTIRDIPISLIDTAGMRETIDTVESMGVERARRAMTDADVVVVVLDSSDDICDEDAEVLEATREMNRIIAVNKIDLRPANRASAHLDWEGLRTVNISAKTGEGLGELQDAIVGPFTPADLTDSGFLVSDARHYDLLVRAEREIRESILLLERNTSEELTLVGLHNSIRYMGEITGETTTEDMLTRIFQTFCIGK